MQQQPRDEQQQPRAEQLPKAKQQPRAEQEPRASQPSGPSYSMSLLEELLPGLSVTRLETNGRQ
jgi:hypothetical protein